LVEAEGLHYHYLPVAWQAPTAADFAVFCALMEAEAARRVFVHCAANKRVSAFVFLYRVLRLGVPREAAERDLFAVWQPDEVWSKFIADMLAL
ncbi:MAG TPA: protein tyrosine phosphatase family protein, partial [Nevskia sp.]|nr:protein tyrosine phosphatase family protein [Nevskia sp.]